MLQTVALTTSADAAAEYLSAVESLARDPFERVLGHRERLRHLMPELQGKGGDT
jgi:hypothetical protein